MQTERLLALACWLEGGAHHKLKIGNRDVTFAMNVGIQALAEFGEDFEPNKCATACCIAGAAVEFFMPEQANALLAGVRNIVADYADANPDSEDEGDLNRGDWYFDTQSAWGPVKQSAQALLDLDDKQAHMLFTPSEDKAEYNYDPPQHMQLSDYTDPAWAARVIRRGVATGNFNWHAEGEELEGEDE